MGLPCFPPVCYTIQKWCLSSWKEVRESFGQPCKDSHINYDKTKQSFILQPLWRLIRLLFGNVYRHKSHGSRETTTTTTTTAANCLSKTKLICNRYRHCPLEGSCLYFFIPNGSPLQHVPGKETIAGILPHKTWAHYVFVLGSPPVALNKQNLSVSNSLFSLSVPTLALSLFNLHTFLTTYTSQYIPLFSHPSLSLSLLYLYPHFSLPTHLSLFPPLPTPLPTPLSPYPSLSPSLTLSLSASLSYLSLSPFLTAPPPSAPGPSCLHPLFLSSAVGGMPSLACTHCFCVGVSAQHSQACLLWQIIHQDKQTCCTI